MEFYLANNRDSDSDSVSGDEEPTLYPADVAEVNEKCSTKSGTPEESKEEIVTRKVVTKRHTTTSLYSTSLIDKIKP